MKYQRPISMNTADGDKRVAQHGGEQCRPEDDVVLFAVHHVSERGGGESAGGECDAGGHVDGDPEAPRVLIVQVRHRADAEKESPGEEDESVEREQDEDDDARREELGLDRCRCLVRGHDNAPLRPSSFRVLVIHMIAPRMAYSATGGTK